MVSDIDAVTILAKTWSTGYSFTVNEGVFSAFVGSSTDKDNQPILTGSFGYVADEMVKQTSPQAEIRLLQNMKAWTLDEAKRLQKNERR